MKHTRATAGLLLGLTLASATATAQTTTAPAAPSSGSQREGFLIGLSIGTGFSSTYRPSFDFHIGGMAKRNVAVMVEFYALDKGDDRTAGIVAASAQYWPAERLWLRGGIGYGSIDSDARLAGIGGVGYEVVHAGRFALDVQLRGLVLKDGNGASINIGFNWY